MTPQEFIAKWQRVSLSERSACQQHFLDLCDVLGQPKPAAADPKGAWYTFERGVHKTTGQKGWADVWMRGRFGWEYKGKHKNLDTAYQQLLLYREDLENPPLLVVCDLDRFQIHTNFTGTAKQVHRFDLEGLADPENLDVLRRLFTDPESLRPGLTTESITRQAAERFGMLADGMRIRGVDAPAAAHFLMKLMFCMFGEDIRLLPEKIFSRVLEGSKGKPKRLSGRLRALFEAMSTGGDFGADKILHFDGGLFADADVVDLRNEEIEDLIRVNDYDWGDVEPSIFGTLFERTLDPAKRSQIGAHYTSRQDILTLLEPVVMTPLRREWEEVRAKCDKLWQKVQKGAPKRSARARKPSKPVRDLERTLLDFVERLAHVKILDPACGSGNFLYVAINLLLDLEKEVIAYGANHDVSILPHVRPTQLAGIEINPYAQQLAQVVIWIGYLQWMHHNGFKPPSDPVLEPIETIHLQDAILDLSDPEDPKEPQWPKADFIVGNPPFLGNKLLRRHLGGEYVETMFRVWDGRVPREADLCCYWFEKAREHLVRRRSSRIGLLATQGIRGGANRRVPDRIKESGGIFFAESDRNWILDGATVHVSMIGFDNGDETQRVLDGKLVGEINANLTSGVDITVAKRLASNIGLSIQGDNKVGAFDIHEPTALKFLFEQYRV
ncbi:MAG: DNA methyltransferase [Planctomycetota bacterium]|jgi:SAM-dependent methyltransferase